MKPHSLFSAAFLRPYLGGVLVGLALVVFGTAPAAAATLGTSSLLVGPTAGSNSVSLVVPDLWSATTTYPWLHVAPGSLSGSGNKTIVFSYDANTGSVRSGTLTIQAGSQTLQTLTLTVTQAGSAYVSARILSSSLVNISKFNSNGVAVNVTGDVYVADANTNLVKWVAATGQTQRLYGPLPYASGGVAVDAIGNAYIADSSNVVKFSESTGVSSFLTVPTLITLDTLGVDSEGNLYVGDFDTSQIIKFLSSDNSQSVLVSGGVVVAPTGVAVDAAGNIFISDNYHQMIQEWQVANGQIIPIVETGVTNVMGIAVDGSGNLFIADNGNNAVKEWVAASKTLITLLPPNQVSAPLGVTLDTSGNLYITADFGLEELSYAFVDPTSKMITTPNAGTGSVAPVLPATINLAHAFPPHFDQSWINITGITNGVISFAFSANTGDHRSANLNLLGVNIPFIQDGLASFSLGYYDRCEGPVAGDDDVILATTLPTDSWTATANVNWLHVVNNQSGNSGSRNIEFRYDANAGATRTGTLTIANHTVTITQAGAAYVAAPAPFTSLVDSGLNNPAGIAVDGFGNVYIADTTNNAIKEWTPANNSVRTLVSTGLSNPGGVAVDVSGNVYIADTGHNAVKEWLVASQTVTNLVSSGLAGPGGVAVNASGDVYIADTLNNTIKVWNPANNTLTSVVSSGLAGPLGVATDVAGNVYIADTQNSAIKKWTAADNLVNTVVASGLNLPKGVAVDGAGNIYIADTLNQTVKKWSAVDFSVSNLSSTGLNLPQGVAADVAGNVYIGDTGNNAIKEQPRAFVDPTPHNVFGPSATDVLPVVLPTYENLLGPFHPVSDQSWLTIGSINNGVVGFGFAANPGATRSGNLTVLGQVIPVTQYRQAVLGASSLLVGPGPGSNGVVLANVGQPWGATAIAAWLHLSAANQAGSGSTNVIFSYDANPGITRTGALSICGFNVIITQAGSTYVPAAGPITALVPSGLSIPQGAAVDGVGNLYFADAGNNAIKKWSRVNNSVSTIVSSGLSNPKGVAVDGAGNVYIADTGHNSIKEWVAADSSVTTLISSGLNGPSGIAVDGATNIYIADTTNNAIKKWTASGDILTTLVSSGLSHPAAVTVDAAGNLYIADSQDNAVKKWALVNGSLSTLAAGLNAPGAVAVDGSGNVFFADTANSAIKEWLVASGTVTNLITSGLSLPGGVAVDAAGDLFLADSGNGLIKELPHAFVDSAPKMESGRAGSDVSVVLPATADLLAPFAPSSDQSWLSIGSINNGVVGFNYAANPGALRSANLTVLGVGIPIIQYRLPYFGSPTLVEGPAAGINSIILVAPVNAPWTNVANAAWLHLGASSQTGSGNANIIFSSDANTGPTRIGTVSVGTQTLTITQAGAAYAAARPLTPLISSGLNFPGSVALDGAGNVYVADQGNSAIKEWVLTNNSVTQVAHGYFAHSLAADVAGNVYLNSDADQSVLECAAGTHAISTLASGVGSSSAVAVDGPGNVYFTVGSSVEEEAAASHALTTLVSGSSGSGPLAVDVAGNLYIANTGIQEWLAGNNTLITLDEGFGATSLAVDVSGNIYFAFSDSIGKWTAANNTVVPFFNTPDPTSVAVDAAGNIYFSNFTSNLVQELPFAFVDATPRSEGAAAGSDVLPAVLPATVNLLAPFAPASDQPWLVITGATNGVVSFTFAANSGFSRVGRITVLGQSIPITQAGVSQFVLGLTARCVGPLAASESVALFSANLPWTATANASWLHVAAGSQSGTESTNVFYSCDANTGTTRSGTLTIAGQTLTVTQAGPNYVAAPNPGATVIPAGVINPGGVTVDGSGNVLAISSNPLLAKWNAASNTIATFPAQIQISAGGLAVDAAGNVYFANGFGSALQEWLAADQTIMNLVTNNLSSPKGVAVDSTGNVYIADSGHKAIKKWIAANNTVTTLVASGLNNPTAVAVDVAGNVYITDTGDTTVKKWNAANGALTTVIGVGLLNPGDVAVDGAGNVYVADTGNNAIKRWTAASNAVATLISTPAPVHVAADNSGGVYFTVTNAGNTLIQELPRAFVNAAGITESPNEGIDGLPVVLPVTTRLLAPFAPTNDQPWLTLHPPNNGVVSFDFTINTNSAARINHLTVLSQSITITQVGTAAFFLGTAARCEGPAAGRDSVSLFGASGVAWTAAANASWLHLVTGSQSGTEGTNVIFSYDANPGAPRIGTLTIAGNTVTVTQAGATFVQAPFTLSAQNVLATTPLVTTLAGVAADNAGNVFFVDSGAKTLLKWTAANNTVTTVVSAGLPGPTGVAVDPLGNVYTCGNNQAIAEWRVADNTVTNLVLAGANNLAVDGSGNLYFISSSGLKKWTAANKTLAPLVIPGLVNPWAVAVDAAANLYFIELGSNPFSVKKWTAASQSLSTVIPSGLSAPYSLSVDGAGNIYIADVGQNSLLKWIAASGVLTNLNSNLGTPQGVAVDATGNLFVTTSTSLLDLPFAYVNLAAGKTEGPGAGSDTISAVLPVTAQLMPPFTPTDNVDWLAITGAGSGAFSFAFGANQTPATRQATLNVFNQPITIFQAAPPNLLGTVKVIDGSFKFQIGNLPSNASFTVLASTDASLPLAQWSLVGTATNITSGLYQFTDPHATNSQTFYTIRLNP